MIRSFAVAVATTSLFLGAFGRAPLQCAGGHGTEAAHEESAGDVLYELALDFHKRGEDVAAHQTLRFLVARYPSNRHVPAARAELALLPTSFDAGHD